MRVYKKWRRNQIALFGAEKLQEQEDQVKKIKQKVVSVGAKYVPSSIQEIQMGTTLDIAKQSRVSFDPDNTLGDEPAEDHEIEDKPTENSVDEVSKNGFAEVEIHYLFPSVFVLIVTHCLKITHNVSFEFFNFSILAFSTIFCLIENDLSGNAFIHVNVARFARNVE